ncbi:alpha-1,6-mannosyl-glycoprotein 2-beta-N-acetylglucosaminyltransferase-like [Haliotis rubra]|uniref:alpha-1,6-mannosyl-glycoprotein 2-beta-N-acetylglucosaminyltransferase-like n=1 Tax=Haliotis rubra TaxID=36100 RepID=UPI001EE53116|nr:alpha-1,6-mannosyl-glycoprotein 2-beta-N-acetylglucosaminyltransferase-like [Haliotis rubra]
MDINQFPMDVEQINAKQHIMNGEKFNYKIKPDSVVILVQVHDRLDILKMQLESFRTNRYINETLLVVSHDYYSKPVFDIIDSIDFCPVLQIFYPYPIQAYNKMFPGDDPNDCPRDLSLDEARKRKCNNAEFPDRYQHYREAKHTQLKHHWLWKLQFVFERSFFKDVPGVTILRLDDDYYLAADALDMIKKMNVARDAECRDCKMFIMGGMENTSPQPYRAQSGDVNRGYWYAGVGRGQAFTKDFWKLLKDCQKAFCLFDDCNWDWALQHVTATCIPGGLKILKPSASRLFHLGKCKGFHRNMSCTTESVKQEADHILKTNSQYLFPAKVQVVGNFPNRPTHDVPYGGWTDIRDHELCFKIYNNKTLNQKDLSGIHQLLFRKNG